MLRYRSDIVLDIENHHAYTKIYDWDGNYCILDLVHDPVCYFTERAEAPTITLTRGDGSSED